MYSAAVVLALVASTLATPFITSPTASTVFKAGQVNKINWQDNGEAPTLKDFGASKISLYVGNAQQQTSLQLISQTDVSATNTIDFNVDPAVGEDSDEYFIRIESINFKDPKAPQYPALAFSSKFRLEGMSGKFSDEIKKQIEGQNTAPLGAPAATPSGGASGSAAAPTGAKPSASGSATSPSKSASAASASNAPENGAPQSSFSAAVVFGSVLIAAFTLF